MKYKKLTRKMMDLAFGAIERNMNKEATMAYEIELQNEERKLAFQQKIALQTRETLEKIKKLNNPANALIIKRLAFNLKRQEEAVNTTLAAIQAYRDLDKESNKRR